MKAGREGVPLCLVRCVVIVDEEGVRIGHPMSCMCDQCALVRVGVQCRWRTGASFALWSESVVRLHLHNPSLWRR